MAETAAARAARDTEFAQSDRVARDFKYESAERLARLYVDDATGANTEFDTIVSNSTKA